MSTADLWLDSPVDPNPSVDDLVLRYLATYGPACVADAQTWSGLTHLSEVFDRLDLRQYTDATSGRTLYDLPHITLPDRGHRGPRPLPPRIRQPPPLPRRPHPLDRHPHPPTPNPPRGPHQRLPPPQRPSHRPLETDQIHQKNPVTLDTALIITLTAKAGSSIPSRSPILLTFTDPGRTHKIDRLAP